MTKVLLVEDNEENRDMLTRRLQRRGYEVVSAADGQQAVASAQADPPDLILMDMNLPVMDGWEATRRIREMPERRGLPIIALTAHEAPADRETIFQSGCDDHHAKPVDLARLLEQIEVLLGRAKGMTNDE